jgi:beta-hydroxylase
MRAAELQRSGPDRITDDDRWKTFFPYGYGFEAKRASTGPRTAALMREIPGMTTACSDSLPPSTSSTTAAPKGVAHHLGLIVPRDAPAAASGGEDAATGGGQEHDLRRHLQPRGLERHRRCGGAFVDAAPAAVPESRLKLDHQSIGISPFIRDARRNQEAWERRYLERRRERAGAEAGAAR